MFFIKCPVSVCCGVLGLSGAEFVPQQGDNSYHKPRNKEPKSICTPCCAKPTEPYQIPHNHTVRKSQLYRLLCGAAVTNRTKGGRCRPTIAFLVTSQEGLTKEAEGLDAEKQYL